MGKFLTQLEVKQINESIWELTSPLIYCSDRIGSVEVNKGFRTDFASVPRIPVLYIVAGGRFDAPASVHDYLYESKITERRIADAVFFEAIKESSVLFAVIYWSFVRVFGWYWWK